MVRTFAILFAAFAWTNAFATAPTINGVSGSSGYNLTGTITIFGGLAGTCTGDNVTPCDSCTAAAIAANGTCATAPLCACNQSRIYDNLVVTIGLTKPSDVTGTVQACIAQVVSGTKTALTQVPGTNGGSYVALQWNTICAALGSASCDPFSPTTTNQLQAEIWLDKNNSGCTAEDAGEDPVTVYFKLMNPGSPQYDVYGNPAEGIGSFVPYPGDQKIRLEQLNTTAGFPNLGYSGGAKATRVRVFISPNSLDDANYQNPPQDPAELNIVDGGDSLASDVVDGLDNDKLYFFRVALVDEASNVVQYFPDRAATDSNGTAHPECTAAGPAGATCPFSATPSQVLGLLSKDFNCFIATAAYGSPLEPKLQTFRDFRHRFLLRNPLGLSFVKFYYTYGPAAAHYIADKPVLRTLVRGALWPLYGFSALALRFGLPLASLFSLCLLILLMAVPWLGRRIHSRA